MEASKYDAIVVIDWPCPYFNVLDNNDHVPESCLSKARRIARLQSRRERGADITVPL